MNERAVVRLFYLFTLDTCCLLVGLYIRRFCLAFDKLSFSQVVQLYQRFTSMFGEMKHARSTHGADVDVATGSIVSETRDLSLDDLCLDQTHSTHTANLSSGSVFTHTPPVSWCLSVALLCNTHPFNGPLSGTTRVSR